MGVEAIVPSKEHPTNYQHAVVVYTQCSAHPSDVLNAITRQRGGGTLLVCVIPLPLNIFWPLCKQRCMVVTRRARECIKGLPKGNRPLLKVDA